MPAAPAVDEDAVNKVVEAALRDMLADPNSAFQPDAFLYQDFSVRCRMQRLRAAPFDLAEFRRRFALAKGGILDPADPHWRDLVLFYEYFHGDNGAGLGASHQTGWTGLVARLMHLFATSSAEQVLAQGGKAVFIEEPVPGGPDRLKD